jgi:ActR/RegA family two-component response regulator
MVLNSAALRVEVMSDSGPPVLVIDDDPALRESVGRLLRSVGLDARLFASVPDFLKSDRPNGPTCLVLDIRLPEGSGLDFQRELAAADIQIPIIFITGHGDIPMSVQAMKGGAIEFLTKPFRDQDLIDAIQLGLARDRARRENEKDLGCAQGALRFAEPTGTRDNDPGRAGPPQQADRPRSRCLRKHSEGPSQQSDAEDERPLPARAWPNGRQTQAGIREDVTGCSALLNSRAA